MIRVCKNQVINNLALKKELEGLLKVSKEIFLETSNSNIKLIKTNYIYVDEFYNKNRLLEKDNLAIKSLKHNFDDEITLYLKEITT